MIIIVIIIVTCGILISSPGRVVIVSLADADKGLSTEHTIIISIIT